MALSSWPRVNEDTTDAQYAELFNSIIGTGVRDPDGLTVTADSTGLNVKVSAGFAVVGGNAFLSTATETLTIAPNTGNVPRYDAIVLRRSFGSGPGATVTLVVKDASATLASDVRGTMELVLAHVLVGPSAATITSAAVVDKRRFLSSRVGIWETADRPVARRGLIGLNTTTGGWETNTDGTANGWGPLVSWSSIPGKPAAIPVSEGGTGATNATAARTNLGAAAASHTHPWSEVTDKPATFPPSTHGHALTDANITGILPVVQGGTGVTNLAALLQALGIFVSATAPAHSNGRVWIKRP